MHFVLQCFPTTTNGSFSLFFPCPNGRLSFPISSSAFFLPRPFPAISFPSFFFFAGAILRRCGTFDFLEADFLEATMKIFFAGASLFFSLAFFSHSPGEYRSSVTVSQGYLFIANQVEHTALVVNLDSRQVVGKAGVDINGHEVAVAPDGHLGYVPIYGDSGVGRPGTDGNSIHVIDLHAERARNIINIGKPVRPNCVNIGPDGLLYVSAQLSNAVYVVDPAT